MKKILNWKQLLVIYIVVLILYVVLSSSDNPSVVLLSSFVALIQIAVFVFLVIAIVRAIIIYRRGNKKIKNLVSEKMKEEDIDPNNYQEYYKAIRETEEKLKK